MVDTTTKIDELDYSKLEELMEEILKELSDETLPLDKATSLYKFGKEVTDLMQNKLEELEKSVKNTINND